DPFRKVELHLANTARVHELEVGSPEPVEPQSPFSLGRAALTRAVLRRFLGRWPTWTRPIRFFALRHQRPPHPPSFRAGAPSSTITRRRRIGEPARTLDFPRRGHAASDDSSVHSGVE